MLYHRACYRTWSQGNLPDSIKSVRNRYFPAAGSNGSGRHSNQSNVVRVSNGVDFSEAFKRMQAKLTGPKDLRIVYLSMHCRLTKELQNGIRSVINLPWPVSQDVRILCFTSPQNYAAAKEAGATIVGGADLIEPLMKGTLQFDRVIASTDMMTTVAKVARILGPKGLMPTIRTGTITDQLGPAIRKALSNVPLRVDKTTGLGSLPIARAKDPLSQAHENFTSILSQLQPYVEQSKGGRLISTARLTMANEPSILLASSAYWKPQAKKLANSELIKKLEARKVEGPAEVKSTKLSFSTPSNKRSSEPASKTTSSGPRNAKPYTPNSAKSSFESRDAKPYIPNAAKPSFGSRDAKPYTPNSAKSSFGSRDAKPYTPKSSFGSRDAKPYTPNSAGSKSTKFGAARGQKRDRRSSP